MVNGLSGSAAGLMITGVMLLSGLVMGGVSSRLLRLAGVRDRKDRR